MNKTKIKGIKRGNMAFEMDLDGHTLVTDAPETIG
ncbi:MAG TPA: OsmC family peroxiredoxin, partial [Clostridiaceae bacterium]|nr:OsmC family peroxiredoxin [Clostridiaceae bacterium]